MANIYDERSDGHAGFSTGTKIETTIDHHEVNRDLAAQTQLTIVSVAHFPTRVIAWLELFLFVSLYCLWEARFWMHNSAARWLSC